MADIIVVGAGPSGSYASRELAKNGLDVLLLEKEKLPRFKPCSGWITKGVKDLLGWDFNERLKDTYCVPTNKLIIYSARLEPVILGPYKEDITWGVSRKDFDYEITKDAEGNGAKVISNNPVYKVNFLKDEVVVKTKEKDYKANIVIGADGVFSVVAASAGVRKRWMPSEAWLCIFSEGKISYNSESGVPLLFPKDCDTGYKYFYPKGEFVNAGIATKYDYLIKTARGQNISTPKLAKIIYNNFVNELKQIKIIDNNILLEKERIWFNPSLYNINSKGKRKYEILGNKFLLVGDAMGISNTYSGEGIKQGMESAKTAVKIILNAGDYSKDSLGDYEEQIIRQFGKEHELGSLLQMVNPVKNPSLFDKFFEELKKSDFLKEKTLEMIFGLKSADEILSSLEGMISVYK